jgi:hypothetical protein
VTISDEKASLLFTKYIGAAYSKPLRALSNTAIKNTAARGRASHSDRCPLRSVTSSLAERQGQATQEKVSSIYLPPESRLSSVVVVVVVAARCPDGRLIMGAGRCRACTAAKRAAAPCCARAAPNAVSTVATARRQRHPANSSKAPTLAASQQPACVRCRLGLCRSGRV